MISTPIRALRRVVPVLLSCITAGSFCAGAEDPLASMQKTAAELARLRNEKAQLESDWTWQREAMSASVEALKQRVAALQQQKGLHEARSSAARQEEAELVARATAARGQLAAADARLREIGAELLMLRRWLPPRLSLALDLAYQGLADPAANVSERIQHISTVWARAGQFNRTITYGEEALALGGGPNPRVMEVIYWGLSHGYALDRSQQTAYFGSPGPDGWTWQEDPSLASRVSTLIAVYRDELEPQFVPVPALITHLFGEPR